MLTASRFTTVPTKDCVHRLEAALSNVQPIARGERHRGAVTAIQSALADLNRAYLLVAEVDGYYGSRTAQAVEAFQRDYGLIADGMVGKQTMTQLDNLYSGGIVRKPRGLSVQLHTGALTTSICRSLFSERLLSPTYKSRKTPGYSSENTRFHRSW